MKLTPKQLKDAQDALAAENEGKPWEWHMDGKWMRGIGGYTVAGRLSGSRLVRPVREPRIVPYTRDTIPLPLVVVRKSDGVRLVTTGASRLGIEFAHFTTTYEVLLAEFTHEDGSQCGRKEDK